MSKKTLLAMKQPDVLPDIGWYQEEFTHVVQGRQEMTDDALGEFLENALSLAFCTLKSCKPLIEEMRRRFKNLERSKHRDGTYSTIRGCRSFQEWCKKVLHRTEQAVYAMLRAGEPKPKAKALLKAPETESLKAEAAKTKISNVGESLPVLKRKNGDGTTSVIPPAEYTPADAIKSAEQFIDSLVRHLSQTDKDIFYRSLLMSLEDRLNVKNTVTAIQAELLPAASPAPQNEELTAQSSKPSLAKQSESSAEIITDIYFVIRQVSDGRFLRVPDPGFFSELAMASPFYSREEAREIATDDDGLEISAVNARRSQSLLHLSETRRQV